MLEKYSPFLNYMIRYDYLQLTRDYLRTVYSRKEWAAAWHPWTIALAQAARSLRVSARKWCVTTPSIVPTRTANVAPCWVVPLLLLAASFCRVGEETSLENHSIRGRGLSPQILMKVVKRVTVLKNWKKRKTNAFSMCVCAHRTR